MLCPHGYLNASQCPQCSNFMNVTPLQHPSENKFVEFIIEREQEGDEPEKKEKHKVGRLLNTDTLKPTRLQPHPRLHITGPSPSTHLHDRLKQLAGKDPLGKKEIVPDEVEARIRQLRKSKFNPFVDWE
ncbi:hypothetical protein GF325_09305 [Candidatus Bathyarchaeota archaeon]|nr:hypothetical protein [Candidatus Bathyarchaeota archaeon]